MASGGNDRDADDALSKLLKMVALQIELLGARPTTLGETFSLARLIEGRVEATAHKKKATIKKEETIQERADTLTSLQSEVASLEAKGSLDARPVDEVHGKFAEFFKDKGSVENVLSATKLPEGGNSHSAYSPYHLEGKAKKEKGYWSWQRKVVRDGLG
ncbi:hypothetical protein Tco_0997036 [Tanacetum coccineum]